MAKSEVSDDLIAAYRAAAYRIKPGLEPGCDAIILRVGHYSEPLSRLFAASGHQCAAFITACNPFSMPQSDEQNVAASARLYDKLNRQLGNAGRIREGEGCDPAGAWPGEKSFLALGLDLETSRALGGEFGQNAIVWADADAIPRLVLLR
ncbi:Protein of unknown function [Nitrosospira sp. Nl5]|uniref:DUF3293 domain-containing protein n=1 Tax=Nitrosospira sp. Nl5 TaxID=200120 RepID=UPI00088CCDA8|nr:DUF3293 domain-containing protein [Nitrosospira sp. Nl5]SCY09242.1 Protein of unknown function [Nitrosospira sp. Nl5]